MSDGGIKLKYTGDSSEAIKAVAAAQKAITALEKENAKLHETSAKGSAAYAKASADTKKIIAGLTTEQEKHNRRVEELNRLKEHGKITEKQYADAVKESNRQLHTTRGTLGDVEKAHVSTFGAAAIGRLAAYAGGFALVSAGIAQAVKLLSELDAKSQEAFTRLQGERAGMSELAGLAGSPAEAQQYVAEAKKAFESGVGKTQDEAAALHYQLRSTNLYEQRKIFEDLSRSGAIRDITPVVSAVDMMQSAFGVKETGDATALISKLYRSSDVTRYEVPEIAQAAAAPSLFAKNLGQTDEELIAQLTVAGKVMPIAEAGTGMERLLLTMQEKDAFKGLGAERSLLDIQAMQKGDIGYFGGAEQAKTRLGEMKMKPDDIADWMTRAEAGQGMDPAAFQTWMGEKRGMVAFEAIMGQMDMFRQEMVGLPKAEETRLAEMKTTLPGAVPEIRAGQLAEVSKRGSEAEDRLEGEARALSEAILAERDTAVKAAIPGRTGQAASILGRGLAKWQQMFVGDEALINQTAAGGVDVSPELRQQAIQHRMRVALERLAAEQATLGEGQVGQVGGLSPEAQQQLQLGPTSVVPVIPEIDAFPETSPLLPNLPPSRSEQLAGVLDTRPLETKTDAQTVAIREQTTEIRGLRQDLQQVPVVPVPVRVRPMPPSTSTANRMHSE
jgi:hypothetical protein